MIPSELSNDLRHYPLGRLISGGQTGVDQIALETALEKGIPIGGWCPKGRLSEAGLIPERFTLREAGSELYQERTRLNVRDSDSTLIMVFGPLTGGTALTAEIAANLNKPFLVLDLTVGNKIKPVQTGLKWLWRVKPDTLNVAGPRMSECPGKKSLIRQVLTLLFCRNGENAPAWPPIRPFTPVLPGLEND